MIIMSFLFFSMLMNLFFLWKNFFFFLICSEMLMVFFFYNFFSQNFDLCNSFEMIMMFLSLMVMESALGLSILIFLSNKSNEEKFLMNF